MDNIPAKFDPRSGSPRKSLAALLSRHEVLPNGCWQWSGARNQYGYGLLCIMVGGKPTTILAHRLQWMRVNGEIPEGNECCHDCPDGDNRACINPDHLWLGTHGDNIRDLVRKGNHNHAHLLEFHEKVRRGEAVYTPHTGARKKRSHSHG